MKVIVCLAALCSTLFSSFCFGSKWEIDLPIQKLKENIDPRFLLEDPLLDSDLPRLDELDEFDELGDLLEKPLDEDLKQLDDFFADLPDSGRIAIHHICQEIDQIVLPALNLDTFEEPQARVIVPQPIDFAPKIQLASAEIEAPKELSAYERLPIDRAATYKIGEILRTMAEKNVFRLLLERKRLEKLGDEINFVHPIKFIGTVFSNPQLVGYMRKIHKSGFKWDGFIDGFGKRFRQEIKANNVQPYLKGLTDMLGIPEGELVGYIHHKDFEGLVLHLMKRSSF